jgi:hypothetical protein
VSGGVTTGIRARGIEHHRGGRRWIFIEWRVHDYVFKKTVAVFLVINCAGTEKKKNKIKKRKKKTKKKVRK